MTSEKKSYTVYMHLFPNGKRYIGITGQKPTARWRVNGNGYKPQGLMWKAITKYGWENIQHIIIAENLTVKQAGELEKTLIAQYKTNNKDYGYNQSIGGENAPIGVKRSDETRLKLSIAHKGHIPATKGTHLSEEQKQHLRAINLGKKLPEDVKRKISEKNKGQKPTTLAIKRAKEACNKAVVFIETGTIYESAITASKATGYTASNIGAHCRGLVNAQKWRFADKNV